MLFLFFCWALTVGSLVSPGSNGASVICGAGVVMLYGPPSPARSAQRLRAKAFPSPRPAGALSPCLLLSPRPPFLPSLFLSAPHPAFLLYKFFKRGGAADIIWS